MSGFKHIILALFLALSSSIFAQETLAELTMRADELFEKEQYVEATPLFVQILALDPINLEWNFKFGACLIYNSGQKEKALRYLNAAVTDPNCDPRAFYFRGRALHLDYQFDAAKKDYNSYLSKRVKKDSRYPVEREIQMCENGKKLLTTFTDIVVMNKQQIGEDKFYDIYHDSQTIGGQIIRNYDFQSKIDKKKGHVPTVHYPTNAKRIFYASYGDDEDSGKDIFMRVKLPNGKWSEPQSVRGGVNTSEDEEYPFLHASGKYLYFSSKGHNSMGGFDIFMSKLDPNTNTFGPAENIDFAISSPDDDLFYVVDSLYQNAYFASARSSQSGTLHVYKVKVARVPLQEVIVMGTFSSTLDPEKQKISIQLVKHSSGADLTKFPADASKGGKYSYVFPQGGKYDYIIDVEGSNKQFKFTVELPFLDEFRPLKQEIIHTTENGEEIVRIVNRFDESVEGSEAIIAQVIRKKSELEVNVEQFDLKELDEQKEKDNLLAELGFEKMTMREVSSQLADLQEAAINNEEVSDRMISNISSELVAKADRIKQLDQMEEELRANASKISDPIAKHKLLTEASQKQTEKEMLLKQADGLKLLLSEVEAVSKNTSDPQKIIDLQEQFESLVAEEKQMEALELLRDNKGALDQVRSNSPEGIRDSYVKETLDLRQEIQDLNTKKTSYEQSSNNVESAIKTLERERQGAKKKDQERIDSELASKQQELQMTQDEIASITQKIRVLEKELNTKDDQLARLQNAMSIQEKASATVADGMKASQEVESIESSTPYDYQSELTQLEEAHPEISGGDPILDWANEIAEEHTRNEEQISGNKELTELERTNRLIENNAGSQEKINQQIQQINSKLQSGPNDRLTQQKIELTNQKESLQSRSKVLKEREKELRKETPDAALSKEDVLAEVSPNFESNLENLASNPEFSERERLEGILEARVDLNEEIDSELQRIEATLSTDPENEEAAARQTLLTELQEENNEEIAATQSQVDGLPVEVEPKSTREVIAELDEDYETRKESLNSGDLTPLEKEKALLIENQNLLKKVVQSESELAKKLKKNPEDLELLDKKRALAEAKEILESEISERQQTIQALDVSPDSNEYSPETVIATISPDYERQIEQVNSSNQTALEKAESLKVLKEALQNDLLKEQKILQKETKKNPDNEEAAGRLAAVDQAIENTTNEIELLENQITGLESTSIQNETAESVIAELLPEYNTQLLEIDASDGSASDKAKRKASVEVGVLEMLKEESARLEKEIKKSPDNQGFAKRKEVVDQSIQDKTASIEKFKDEAVAAISESEKKDLIDAISPEYLEKIGSSESNSTKIEAEQELQEALQELILEKEKQLQRKYSVTVEIEKLTLEKLTSESEQRESDFENNSAPFSESDFIASIRKEDNRTEQAMKNESSTLEDLNAQEETLKAYETSLDSKIEDKELEVNENPTTENENELNWLLTEKERVIQKRRSVGILIGELEQSALNDKSENPDLGALQSQKKDLREKLESDNLPSSERKQLRKELAEVEEKQLQIENEILTKSVEENQKTTSELQNALFVNSNDNSIIERVADYAAKEEALIENQEKQAERANSEAEKNYLLNQAQEQRERLNDDLRDALVEQQLNELQEEFEIETTSANDLEAKKRKYTIEIGELSREIQQVDQDLESAKRRDLPELESKRETLVARKLQLESKLTRVNEQLIQKEETPLALNPKALDEDLTFNEERKLASSETYEIYQKAASEALLVANEIRNLEEELNAAQVDLQNSVIHRESEETIRLKARKIREIEDKLDENRIDLRQKKYVADQALPNNDEEAMKMQNLVARGIQPIKIAAVATSLIQIPTTGFAIDTTSERPNNGSIEIPVDVASPEGLVYRVQVGAFAKPLRDDVFKEFNPVSGEKIAGTNITRYMAGYFNSSETVVDARAQIRDLGYSDAFIVAYCNGERVTFSEARRLEAAGICVPKRSEDLVMEVVQNTAKKLDLPLTPGELKEVPELTYNQAPGATEADPIENMEGLFFTVQVGVFNRPVSAEDIFNLPNIMTFRLPNGQIRYNTGMFDSAEDAVPRQNFARQSGVQGAFIVAYYKGERISIGNARRLLASEGNAILQSRKDIKPVEKIENSASIDSVSANVVEIIPMEEWEKRVQVVTEKTFDEFPRDVLNRYNAEGSFYYDSKDKRVKSVIYKNEEYLPNLFNFQNDVDTIYFQEGVLEDERTEILGMVFKDSLVPGDFMDWLLRCEYRRHVYKTYKGVEVRIFAIPEDKMDQMVEDIRVFGVEPERIIETEEELERDENNE